MTPRPPRPVPLLLLAFVTLSGTLAMHMFVPALTTAAQALGTDASGIQMTISLYVLGLAVGQLVWGPLSDRFGRRPMLMAGLALYSLSGLVCLLAPSLPVLVAGRFAQALGGCAGLLLARAVVRDVCEPHETLRRLALLGLITLAGPGLAPLVGGFITVHLGWRANFEVFLALGVAGLVLVWRLLPETRPPGQHATGVLAMAGNYRELLRMPAFVGCVVGGGCGTTAMYAFVSAAPFVFVEQLHEPVEAVGVYLALLAVGISIGNLLAGRLARRVPIQRLMVGGNALSTACALFFLGWVLFAPPDRTAIVASIFLYCVGVGLCSPAASTLALRVDPRLTGSAAGFFGFFQMAVGALCTWLAGTGSNHALAAAGVMAGAGVIAQAGFRFAIRHLGEGRGAPAG